MNEAYTHLNKAHTLLTRGVTSAIYTVNIAQWLALTQVESRACGVEGRTFYQDLGLQIYFGTAFTRIVILPVSHWAFKKMAARLGVSYPLDETFDLIEVAAFETLSIFTYSGGSRYIRLIMPPSLYTTVTPTIAGVLASIPLGQLCYKLFINSKHYRGAYQDYAKQFSDYRTYLLTGLEVFTKAAMMGSLALKLTECIIDTVIDAMRNINLTPEQERMIFEIILPIASIIGMISVVHPYAWKFLVAASTTANVFYSTYNFPLSILTCLFPIQLGTAAGYINGGWAWELLCASIAFAITLPASIKAYRNIYEETTTFFPASISDIENSDHQEIITIQENMDQQKITVVLKSNKTEGHTPFWSSANLLTENSKTYHAINNKNDYVVNDVDVDESKNSRCCTCTLF